MRPKIKNQESKKLYPVTTLKQETNLARGRYGEEMSLPEFKIWMVAASQDSLELKTTATELCKMAKLDGYGVRRYQVIESFLTSLGRREVHFLAQDPETQKFRFSVFPLLAAAHYEEGNVKIQINPKLAPYIHNLKRRFTAINLKELLSVDSYHQARLYMLACSCKHLTLSGARTFTISDLALSIGIKYTEGHERTVVYQVKRCQKALEKNIGVQFFITVLKTGRKISAIRFDFPKTIPKKQALVKDYIPSV